MMTDKEKLLKKLSSAQFAAWETRIYLDTHPDNQTALNSFKKYNDQAQMLKAEYEKQYGPLSSSYDFMSTTDAWVKGPWPWEGEA